MISSYSLMMVTVSSKFSTFSTCSFNSSVSTFSLLIRESTNCFLISSLLSLLIFALRKKCSYSELFWSVFSHTRTECGEILCISPYSVRMLENTYQNNSEYGHFLHSGLLTFVVLLEPPFLDYEQKITIRL